MELSLRQKRVLKRFPRSRDAREILAWQENQPPRKWKDGSGNQITQGEWWAITLKAKPKPLRPDIQKRLDRLNAAMPQTKAIAKQLRKNEIDARLAKLRAFDTSKFSRTTGDSITSKIHQQLRTQPEMFRPHLSALYDSWIAFNAEFFGGELRLPIIRTANLRDHRQTSALANCTIDQSPCVITFDNAFLLGASTERVKDVLLHEQVHQAVHQLGEHCTDDRLGGHHSQFASICNRIAKIRGWENCYVGKQGDPDAAHHWPNRHYH